MIDGLFWFNRPRIFASAMEMLMLAQCFFLGLSFILHIHEAILLLTPGLAAVYIIFSILPHFIVLMWVLPAIISRFVFIHSVGHVNRRVLEHVLSSMQEVTELKFELSERLKEVCRENKETAAELFGKLSRHSGSIEKKHLRSALRKIEIILTESQVSRLMRVIDLDQNGINEQ